MSAIPACPVADLSNSIGIILASVFVASILYGVTCIQTFIYFVKYPKDGLPRRSMVFFLWVVNTVQEILICLGIWQYLVTHFGDFAFQASFHVPLPLATIITSIASTTVQGFFVWRIWMLSKRSPYFPVVMIPAIIAQPVLCIIYLIESLRNPSLEEFARLNSITFAANGIAAGVDIAIAVFMGILLVLGRTGFRRTDQMIVRLMFITVNTGAWTALFALVVVILSAVYPGQLTSAATYFPLCSLYVNTLLANLNSRSYIRGSDHQHITDSVPVTSIGFSRRNNTSHGAQNTQQFSVYMETTKTSDYRPGGERSNQLDFKSGLGSA
ncbi:hypothetical protein AX16_009092 [Volvariella volvacea WC 439]|nr:hypothetical protein AX16_009092 [Volvariella volvacea WC 439]